MSNRTVVDFKSVIVGEDPQTYYEKSLRPVVYSFGGGHPKATDPLGKKPGQFVQGEAKAGSAYGWNT